MNSKKVLVNGGSCFSGSHVLEIEMNKDDENMIGLRKRKK